MYFLCLEYVKSKNIPYSIEINKKPPEKRLLFFRFSDGIILNILYIIIKYIHFVQKRLRSCVPA